MKFPASGRRFSLLKTSFAVLGIPPERDVRHAWNGVSQEHVNDSITLPAGRRRLLSGSRAMTTGLKRIAALIDTYPGKSRMQRFRSGWPAVASDDIKFYQSPKVQYRYRESGEGMPIVFTADPPATLEFYDELLSLFSTRFRTIVVELPAMGFSATTASFGFGWRETNDDLAGFLRDVAGTGAVLAFSCVAGLAAIDIAVRKPNLVSKLVLLQTGSVEAFARWKATRDPKGILGRPILGQLAMKRLAHKRMPQWYQLSVGNQGKLEHFCHCARESFSHGAIWSLASAYQSYMDPDITLGIPEQPILAIWGLADRSHPTGNADTARALSDRVRFIAYQDLGHAPELEDPARIFKDVCEFCA